MVIEMFINIDLQKNLSRTYMVSISLHALIHSDMKTNMFMLVFISLQII